jgi:hypothetical protein
VWQARSFGAKAAYHVSGRPVVFEQKLHIMCVSGSVAELEPQGAVSFGRSRSRNAMWLRLKLRLRSDKWHKKWLGIEKLHKMKQFITHSVHIFDKINRTESNEKDSFNMCLNFSSF